MTSETEYWLELAQGADLIALTASEEPLRETQELLAIFVASGRTAKSRRCPPIPHSAFRISALDICGERPDSKIMPLTPIPQSAIRIFCRRYLWRAAGQQNYAVDPPFRNPRSAFRIFCSVRRNTPPRTIDARNPPFPFSAASAPGPKARSIQ